MVRIMVEFETEDPEDFESFLDECFYGTGDKWKIIKSRGCYSPKP